MHESSLQGLSPPLCVVLGNEMRRDDGFGPLCAKELRDMMSRDPTRAKGKVWEVIHHRSDSLSLCELWQGRRTLLIDIFFADLPDSDRGSLRIWHPFKSVDWGGGDQDLVMSPHRVCLNEACAWGKQLGLLPEDLLVIGAGGASVEYGEGISPLLQWQAQRIAQFLLRGWPSDEQLKQFLAEEKQKCTKSQSCLD